MLPYPLFNDAVFVALFGENVEIMVFISIDELLPTEQEYKKNKITIIGYVTEMAIMSLSLLLFM